MREPVLFYFNLFLKNHLSNCFEAPFARISPSINKDFITSRFFKNIEKFNAEFENWLLEMEKNQRSFVPFELNPSSKEIYKYVNQIEPKTDGWFSKKNFDLFTEKLNIQQRKISSTQINQKFIELFYHGTKELVNEKFKF